MPGDRRDNRRFLKRQGAIGDSQHFCGISFGDRRTDHHLPRATHRRGAGERCAIVGMDDLLDAVHQQLVGGAAGELGPGGVEKLGGAVAGHAPDQMRDPVEQITTRDAFPGADSAPVATRDDAERDEYAEPYEQRSKHGEEADFNNSLPARGTQSTLGSISRPLEIARQ